jgi:hypothetical protein
MWPKVLAHMKISVYIHIKTSFSFFFKSPEHISDPILMKFLLLKADVIAVYYHDFEIILQI